MEESKDSKKTLQEDGTQIGEAQAIQIHAAIKAKKISPFLNLKHTWDDEEYKIPEDIKKGIKDSLNWERPSRIQAMAIPYIINRDEDSNEFESLIAQANKGAGKSGAFIIGSLLRIDPAINKNQVIIIGHTRELVNQTAGVIARILEYAKSYKLSNLATDKYDPTAHIVVSTLG